MISRGDRGIFQLRIREHKFINGRRDRGPPRGANNTSPNRNQIASPFITTHLVPSFCFVCLPPAPPTVGPLHGSLFRPSRNNRTRLMRAAWLALRGPRNHAVDWRYRMLAQVDEERGPAGGSNSFRARSLGVTRFRDNRTLHRLLYRLLTSGTSAFYARESRCVFVRPWRTDRAAFI